MKHALLISLIALSVLTCVPSVARADLMSACATEIGQYCSDVDRGRGRVTACLASHTEKLSASCRPEVNSAASSRLVPNDMRKIFDPGFRAGVPPSCQTAAETLCPSVASGDGRIFACLYAHSNQVADSCTSAAQATLRSGN
jgi:hypothetical protein